jgi:anti-sigma factor RsiW
MSDQQLRSKLHRLLGPGQPEIICEVCFDELDHYVDLELAGADPEAAIPGMRAHLNGCPACAEEHQSLTALLRHEQGHAL